MTATEQKWQRVPAAKIVEHRDGTVVLGPDGRVHRFSSDSGALVAEDEFDVTLINTSVRDVCHQLVTLAVA